MSKLEKRNTAIMRLLQSSWFPVLLGIIITIMILRELMTGQPPQSIVSASQSYIENTEWHAPSDDEIPAGSEGDQVRFGKELIVHTSSYLGRHGFARAISNGMNCQNCHLDAGARSFANPFSAVASTYPKYRERSGRVESVEWRINECMERSLNGHKLDSLSPEMRAMVAYLNWMGKEVPKNLRPRGAGTLVLPFLDRAADTGKGRIVYESKCNRCHGLNGEGQAMADSTGYIYPPLWGSYSYNTSAGMFLLSRLAGFIKNNMPFDRSEQKDQLTNEEAWDVAAYVNSRPRPQKVFPYDWPDISKKPIDFPFGPYTDNFSESQHKYGPFGPIRKRKEGLAIK